jgi:thiol-disulfide isomerase/thioredoxin
MKKSYLWCVIITLLTAQQVFSQATEKPFILKGSLKGAHADSALIYYADANRKYVHKAAAILNNEFTLKGSVIEPENARILFKNKDEVIPGNKFGERMREFYVEPTVMNVIGDPSNLAALKFTGSKTQQEMDALNIELAPVRLKMQPIIDASQKEKDHVKADSIRDLLDPYRDEMTKITYRFFLSHPNSYVTADLVKYYVSQLKLDSVKKVYNNFNTKLKESQGGKYIANEVKKMEAGSPGSTAASFSTTDINGKLLSLADFKGRYVMLDFWASWCVPCRKSNPHMIEVYNKYKAKGFDVISISDDDSKPDAWKNAVAQDNIGIWHHVLRGFNMALRMKGLPNSSDVNEKFGIQTIPTKILIDPNGKIIGRYGDSNGGSDDDMDEMLAAIFGK